MSATLIGLSGLCLLLFLVQGLAAVPWLIALTRQPLRRHFTFYLTVVGVIMSCGELFALLLYSNSAPETVTLWGRLYGSVLTVQLTLDLLVAIFYGMLTIWPKGGAVALAAFQESVRQPMFWLLTFFGVLVMVVSIVMPYFTFGEDLKMVKEICFAFTMMIPALLGVMSASMSVSEEIEGRTAVTLLSKPVTRRDFLLGKFVGILLASALMTTFLGCVLVWVVLAKSQYYVDLPGTADLPPDPNWLVRFLGATVGPSTLGDLLRGIGLWANDTANAIPGLVIGFGQVTTLLAIAVALATRVPMMVNLVGCLVVYLLGHLTPVMTEVSRIPLVKFLAQLFELLLPSLDHFDVSTAIVREVPLDPVHYSQYTVNVALYALMYAAIAMLAGLILFEDRDVA